MPPKKAKEYEDNVYDVKPYLKLLDLYFEQNFTTAINLPTLHR